MRVWRMERCLPRCSSCDVRIQCVYLGSTASVAGFFMFDPDLPVDPRNSQSGLHSLAGTYIDQVDFNPNITFVDCTRAITSEYASLLGRSIPGNRIQPYLQGAMAPLRRSEVQIQEHSIADGAIFLMYDRGQRRMPGWTSPPRKLRHLTASTTGMWCI